MLIMMNGATGKEGHGRGRSRTIPIDLHVKSRLASQVKGDWKHIRQERNLYIYMDGEWVRGQNGR